MSHSIAAHDLHLADCVVTSAQRLGSGADRLHGGSMDTLLGDVRYGIPLLARAPGLTLATLSASPSA